MKVHRKPTPENVVIALLIEPLQPRKSSLLRHPAAASRLLTILSIETPADPTGARYTCLGAPKRASLTLDADAGYQGFWLSSGIRNMLNLQVGPRHYVKSSLTLLER
jgi:hypothetical protein